MSESELINSLTGAGRPEESRRRAFVQTAIGFAAAMIVYGVVIGAWLPGEQLGIWIPVFVAVGSLTLAFWARRARSIAAPAYVAVGIGIAAAIAGASISGGIDDYTTPFFVVIPVVAGFFLGARGAVICGLAAIAGATALAAGDILGFVVETPYSEVYFEGASGIVLVACIALTMFTARQFSKRVDEHAANLTQSNELLSAFARTAPIAVAMFDRDIRYIEASDRWLSDYGLKRENLIGRLLYDVSPNITQRWKEVHERCLAGATERSEAEKILQKDGTERWLHWEVRPWRDPKGKIGGVIALTRDITDQIRTQETLKAARRQALEASNAKSAFLAAMSHEIRTPLNAVIGLTEALLDTDLNERQRKLLVEANSSGAHLLTLISDVLDLSKLEAGKMALDPAPFNLSDTVSTVVAMFASAAEDKGVILDVSIAPNARGVFTADESRLRQILVNIVGNALKFTASGRIDIRARCVPGSDHADGDLHIDIADTGVGIAPDRLPTLFEAFAQADASIARRFGGTGLGLAICRKLLEEMGGDISCDSAPGEGSTFRVRLPVKVERAAALSGERRPPVDGALDGLRVLFIDDNAGNRLV
ncbi:MAG: ATP-binding protein [Amphiplicatus sp.]